MADEGDRADSERGQTLAEFAILAGLVTILVVGAARWSLGQWHKVECLHAVFTQAHSNLLDAAPDKPWVTAERVCGRSRERLTLRTLDSFRAGEL